MTADLATDHFPRTRSEFMAAAVRLRRESNLKAADIAVVLRLSANAVRDLLYEADTGTQRFGANTYTRRQQPED